MLTFDFSQIASTLANVERLDLLRRAQVLDTAPEEEFDRLARLARQLTSSPVALISFFSESEQLLKSNLGVPEPWATQRTIPLLESFCLQVVAAGTPTILENVEKVSAETNAVQHAFDIGAYLGVPLNSADGHPLGAFCVMDHAPRPWPPEQQAALRDLADTVLSLFNLRLKSADANAHRLSEERLQLIASATRDVIYDLTLTDQTIWWSRGLVMLLGYQANQVVNTRQWWLDHIHPDDQSKVADGFAHALAAGQQFWSKEYRFKRADESYTRLFDRGYVIQDDQGTPLHFVGSVSDISGYRQAEEAWQESEARLQQLVETTDQGVWLLDRHNRTTFVNDRMAEMLGRTRVEMSGTSVFDYLDDDGRAIAQANLTKRRQGGPSHYDFKLKRKDGTDLWGLINIGPLRAANGEVIGGYAMVSDITDRKQAEAALQKAYAENDDLYHNAPCGYHSVSPDGTFLKMNDTELRWLGYTRAEVVGHKTIQELLTPDSRQKLADSTTQFLGNGGVRDLELDMVCKDGSLLPVLLSSTALRDAEGNFLRSRTVIFDRSEHKQTEELLAHERDLLQTLMDSIPDTIYFKDAQSRFTRINQAQTKVLGVTTTDEVLGKTDLDFFPDQEFAKGLFAKEQEMMRLGTSLIDQIEEHFQVNGPSRWYSSTKVPIRDRQGQVVGMVGVSRDITERRRAEVEMQAQRALFENLVAVARATSAMPSLEATLQNALRVSAQLTGARRGSLFLLNEQAQVTHSIRSEGEQMEQPRVELVGQVMQRGLAGWVTQHRVSVLVADTDLDNRWMPSPDLNYQARSALAVPIVHGDSLLGIVTLLHNEPRRFTSDHLKLMEAAADQMALALRNARMLDETQRLAEQMYMLNHISQAALAATTLDDLYQSLADRIGELFGSDACQITYWHEARQAPQSKASSDPAWHTGGPTLLSRTQAEALTPLILSGGRALAIPDAAASTILNGELATSGVQSVLGLPLIAHNRKLGAVILAFETQQAFAGDEASLGERVARQVALALSNALLYREAAEERGRLQALIDSSRDGVVLIGLDRRIQICNVPTLRMLELPGQPADWVGKPLRKALLSLARFAPQVLEIAIGETRRIAVGDEPAREGEYQIANRSIHWMNLPVLSESMGRLLVLRDVTEERNVEKMQADLAHMMVHDLRSPLTSIIGATDLLAKKMAMLKDADQELAEIVRDSAERMLGLVNDILNVSQLEAGQMPLESKPVALGPLVTEVLQLQNGALARKQIRVERPRADTDLPMVWGDLRLLVRVMQNLIGNAVKFTPNDGTIKIEASVEDNFLVVSIENSGEGIPPEIKGRLFSKFVRGNQREHGSGLGLAFCHLVVEAHGGHIWVESEPGEGAAFKFTIPLYQPRN